MWSGEASIKIACYSRGQRMSVKNGSNCSRYFFFLWNPEFLLCMHSGHTIEKLIKKTYLDCFVILQGIGTNCLMRVQPKNLAAAGRLFRPKTIEKLRHFSYVCKKKFHFRPCNWKKGLQALIFLQIVSFECIALLSYDFLCQKLGNAHC